MAPPRRRTGNPQSRMPTVKGAEAALYVAWAKQAEAETALYETQRASEALELEKSKRSHRDRMAEADQHRIFTFYADVDHESVGTCMQTLGDWHRRDPEQPLTVLLNSPGGYCTDGLALYDFMLWLRAKGHRLEIIVLGEASSMGGIILQAADNRVMGRTAELMIHEVAAGQVGSVSKIEDKAKYLRKLNRRLDEILAERSTMTAAEIERKAKNKDWFLTPEEALDLGFIDEVR